MARRKVKDPRRVNDYWTRRAKAENYPARSVYKLEEVDKKHNLLRPGQKVLDLGFAPGSWLMYAAGRTGPKGLVVGVDIRPPDRPPGGGVKFIQADVLDLTPEALAGYGPFDVVLSDLAPATTGIKTVDQARSFELAQAALRLARTVLKTNGALLVKIFQSPDADVFFRELEADFRSAQRVKPKSSRNFSPEIFVLGLGFHKQ